MTPAQHDPERDLNRTLNRQADRFAQHASPLELDAVLNRAGEIRRGRRMRATMVMAAVVLAVAVPVGITTLGENDPTKQKEPGIAATPSPDTAPIDLGGFNNGSAPKNGYVIDGTLRYAGHQTPVGDVTYLVRINGGFLVGSADKVRFVSDDGRDPDETWDLGGSFGVSPEKNVGAFTEPDGTVIAVQDAGSRFFEVGKLPAGSYRTVAVSGENCSGRSDLDACTVWVVATDEKATTWKVSPNGVIEKAAGLADLIALDAEGNSIRAVAYDDTTGRTSAYSDIDGNEVWRTSTYAPKSFSPDGRHLIAGPANGDGFGDRTLTVLDSETGKPVLNLKVAETTGPQVTVYEVVWEDDTHLLATIVQGDETAILRFGLDGTREYAVPRQTMEDAFGSVPFRLG